MCTRCMKTREKTKFTCLDNANIALIEYASTIAIVAILLEKLTVASKFQQLVVSMAGSQLLLLLTGEIEVVYRHGDAAAPFQAE